MRPYCIFIVCLVLFTFCSLAQSELSQGPKCCFIFTSVKIPVKQVERYHTTHPICHKSGIIIITKSKKEICADPAESWVQRLVDLMDSHAVLRSTEHKRPVAHSNVGTKAKKESKSIRTTETTPLHRPEKTTLVHTEDSHDWKTSEPVRTSETPPLHQPGKTTLVHLKESQDWKASESVRTTETTPLHRLEKMCLVHFKDSHNRSTYFCMRPG